MNELMELKGKAVELFVKNGADVNKPEIVAAITEAARYMAIAGEVAKKQDTEDAVLAAFNASDNEAITALMDRLNPILVRQAIGFSPDYMDYGSAAVNYQAQQQQYDEFYGLVNKAKAELKAQENTNEMTM